MGDTPARSSGKNEKVRTKRGGVRLPMRKERTVFDGIEPNEGLNPRVVDVIPALIAAWEESLAERDEKIADLMKARAAHVRNLTAARRKLSKQCEAQDA